ncbi:hypothetical protein B4U79_07540 [Dinothrombium tinctorium]|uniref:Uncharacterized protein n=1 Tax=Dinothrombium tinctorium TaxID=1965070 RepID=A0A443QXD4_9ACAR|nr:hypothetical protein B4U79_07540 [Dinothrombium tinctorium]
MGLRRRRNSSISSEDCLLQTSAENNNDNNNLRLIKARLAKRKKADGRLAVSLQILAVTTSIAFTLYTYFYFEHFHANIVHIYADKMDDHHAQHTLGHKLLKDNRNTTGAFHWFRRSADNGHPHSAYNLAAGHLSGYKTDVKKGKSINFGEVKKLLEYAAQNGVEEAEELLNTLCKEKPTHCDD